MFTSGAASWSSLWSDPNNLLATVYAIIITITLFIMWGRRPYYKLSRQFPGPLELPFIGVFHRMAQPSELLPCLKMAVDIYESPTVFLYFGPQPILYTTHPPLMEKVFTSPDLFNKPSILYDPLSNLFGDGLFSSHAAKWHAHRKLINPSFRLPILRSFLPIFNKNGITIQHKLTAMLGKGPQNLNDLLQKLTLTAAVETILGRHMPDGTEVDDSIVYHYNNVLKSTLAMVILNVVKLSGLAKHFSFFHSRASVFSFVNELIQERMDKIKNTNNNVEKTEDDLFFSGNRNIFIDQALKSYERKQFNLQDVNDESNSIIFAAFDTTASAMYFLIIFLAMHPEVQEKLHDEIKSIFPDKEFTVAYEQLELCTYLEMVVSETLRLAPTVPTIARGVMKDHQLTEDILLPKDLVVLVNIFQVHRNVDIWGPDAEKFNPDNFLPHHVEQRHKFGYIPFSKGLRNCIGGRYALLALKTIIIHTIRNFRFTTLFKYEDLEYINYVTLKLEKYPLLEVHKRDD